MDLPDCFLLALKNFLVFTFIFLFFISCTIFTLSCRISAVQFQNWITLSFCFYYSSRISIMPKSVPHFLSCILYTMDTFCILYHSLCRKCILHRERKEMCKIPVPVLKTWEERDRRRGRKNVGGWRERERERERGGGGGGFWTCYSTMAFDLYR